MRTSNVVALLACIATATVTQAQAAPRPLYGTIDANDVVAICGIRVAANRADAARTIRTACARNGGAVNQIKPMVGGSSIKLVPPTPGSQGNPAVMTVPGFGVPPKPKHKGPSESLNHQMRSLPQTGR